MQRGGDSHTHVQSESQSEWHDGPNCFTCDTHSQRRAEERGGDEQSDNAERYGWKMCQTAASEQFSPPSRRQPGQALWSHDRSLSV